MASLPANDTRDALVNLELEGDVLGSLMADNGLVDHVADHLRSLDFAEPLHQRLYDTIVQLALQGTPANPVTLKGHFADDPAMVQLGGPAYLMRLTASASMISTGENARFLAGLAERRRMRDGLQDAALSCSNMSLTSAELVSMADAALVTGGDGAVRESTAAQCLGELIDGFDDPVRGTVCQHIQALDELHGPMEPAQLIILAARPGMGKTACALSYALGAGQAGHGVLFVSLEMNRQQLAGRMAADLCFDGQAIPYSAIRDRALNDFQRRRVVDAYSALQSLPIQVVDAGSLSTGRLSAIVRRQARKFAAQGHKLELVVVDYLQLLRPDARTNGKYEAVSEVSMALKALAKDNDLAVLALAQLSRVVETRPDKRPQLSDLRDSGQIEQDADSVIFLLRNEYYLRKEEPDAMDPKRVAWEQAMEQARDRIEFIVAKKRNGVEGCATGSFHGAYQAVR